MSRRRPVFDVLKSSDAAPSPARATPPREPVVYRAERYEIHPARRQVRHGDVDLELGARAFDLLVALVESRDRVLTKRELLARVWPGLVVEENTLHAQVSLLRRKLGRAAIATVSGQGYRFVDRVVRGREAEVAAARPAPATAADLPVPATRFIGREQELSECLRLLRRGAALTVTGMGGAGKTRLAIEAARARHAEGAPVWFVDLSAVADGAQVVPAVAAAVGVREPAGGSLLEALTRQLRAGPGLLVLDNCEHLSDAVADAVRGWSALRPGLEIVATSRQPLRVPGEQIFALPALSLPASRAAADVLRAESVRLFADRASLLDPHFVIDPGDAGHVADICERLDGIPLAIELAAARTRLLTVQQLSERLDARFRLLVGGTAGSARQQTLQASMQWSYELLDAAEQRLFRELAVFAGGATLESVASVCDAGDEHEALDGLTSLHDKSLVVVERGGGGPPRYGMLQIVREFGREALDREGDDGAKQRHLDHFVALAEQLVPRARPSLDGPTLDRLRQEQDNFRAAMAWCDAAPASAGPALRLAGALWPYWLATARLDLGEAFTARALEIAAAAADAPREALARALLGRGNLSFYRGRYAEAQAAAREALRQARAADDRATIGFALKLLAGAHHALGEHEPALANYHATLQAAIEIDDAALQAAAHNNLAEVHRGLGHLSEAEAAYRKAIEVGEAAGQHAALALVMCNLARLRLMMDRPRDAALGLLEAHTLALLTSNRRAGDDVIDIAAAIASRLADHPAAARFCGASLARLQESGSRREPLDEAFLRPWTALSRSALGDAAFEREQTSGLAMSYDRAMVEAGDFLRRFLGAGDTGS